MLAFDGPLLHVRQVNPIIVVLRSEILQSWRLVVVMVLLSSFQSTANRFSSEPDVCHPPRFNSILSTMALSTVSSSSPSSKLCVSARNRRTRSMHSSGHLNGDCERTRCPHQWQAPVNSPPPFALTFFAADFSTGAFVTTPVGDVAALAGAKKH